MDLEPSESLRTESSSLPYARIKCKALSEGTVSEQVVVYTVAIYCFATLEFLPSVPAKEAAIY